MPAHIKATCPATLLTATVLLDQHAFWLLAHSPCPHDSITALTARVYLYICTASASVSTAWHQHISLSSCNRSCSWSHDSTSDLPARQRSSCQRPDGRRLVTDLSLPPAPGPGTVCRPLSPQRLLCHHSVDTWSPICSQSRFHRDDDCCWLTWHAVTV